MKIANKQKIRHHAHESFAEICEAVSDGGALVLIGFFIVCAIFGVIWAIFEREF